MTSGTTAAERIRKVIRQSVLEGTAYHVTDAAGLVKLDAMENPYPWPEELRGHWLEALRGISLNRYPDADAGELKSKLRTAFSIPAGPACCSATVRTRSSRCWLLPLRGREPSCSRRNRVFPCTA